MGPARVRFRKLIELKHFGSLNVKIRPSLGLGPEWVAAQGPAAGTLKSLILIDLLQADPSLRNDGVGGSDPLSGTTHFIVLLQ